jgi:GntR family transcriptional regulator/MocR family aminotransferase
MDEESVVAAAKANGVGVYGVAPYRLSPGPPGLIFGYATLTEETFERVVELLADAVVTRRA